MTIIFFNVIGLVIITRSNLSFKRTNKKENLILISWLWVQRRKSRNWLLDHLKRKVWIF